MFYLLAATKISIRINMTENGENLHYVINYYDK